MWDNTETETKKMNFLENNYHKKQAYKINLLERRLVFVEASNDKDLDREKERQKITEQYETAEDLTRLSEKARNTIYKESDRWKALGGIRGGFKTGIHLPKTLGTRIARQVHQDINKEVGIKTTGYNRIVEATQRRILGLGTERVANNHESRIKAKTMLEQERGKMIEEIKLHGYEVKTEKIYEKGNIKHIIEKSKDREGKSQDTEDKLWQMSNSWIPTAKIGNAVLKFTNLDWVARHPGTKHLKREITGLDKAINKLNTEIETGQRIFDNNKASKNIGEMKIMLQERLGINEEEFQKYYEAINIGGKLPTELKEKLKNARMERLIGPLRRAMKSNKFGSLGTGWVRKAIKFEKGKVAERKERIDKTVKDDETAQENLGKGPEYANTIKSEILSRKLIQGSAISFTFDGKYMSQIRDRTKIQISNDNKLNLILKRINSDGTLTLQSRDGRKEIKLNLKDKFLTDLSYGNSKGVGRIPLGFASNIETTKIAKREVDQNKANELADKIKNAKENATYQFVINSQFKSELSKLGITENLILEVRSEKGKGEGNDKDNIILYSKELKEGIIINPANGTFELENSRGLIYQLDLFSSINAYIGAKDSNTASETYDDNKNDESLEDEDDYAAAV